MTRKDYQRGAEGPKPPVELEATHLRGNLYAVRPKGQLGTCGWVPEAWTVQYVHASNESAAVAKAGRAKL